MFKVRDINVGCSFVMLIVYYVYCILVLRQKPVQKLKHTLNINLLNFN